MIKKLYKRVLPEKSRNKLRSFATKATYPFYLGNQVQCNCCGKSFRKFIPKGNVVRLNAKCPACFSLERTRVIDFYLDRELHIYQSKGLKILHFAPEEILFKKLSTIEGEYIDGDINTANARFLIDITSIPYDDNYFDVIICCHVLGHVPDEPKAIQEMKRVLDPNGVALVMTVMDISSENTVEDPTIKTPQQRLKKYGENDLTRLHGLDFGKRLRKEGFTVEEIDYRKTFTEADQQRYSLGNGQREVIFKCTLKEKQI